MGRGQDVILKMPYVPGGRSDRMFRDGGTRYVSQVVSPVINSLGFAEVVVYDPHSYVIENCIERCKHPQHMNAREKAIEDILNELHAIRDTEREDSSSNFRRIKALLETLRTEAEQPDVRPVAWMNERTGACISDNERSRAMGIKADTRSVAMSYVEDYTMPLYAHPPQQPDVAGWIPVSDKLPTAEGKYLVWDRVEVVIAHFRGGQFKDTTPTVRGPVNMGGMKLVTQEREVLPASHWMPMPNDPTAAKSATLKDHGITPSEQTERE